MEKGDIIHGHFVKRVILLNTSGPFHTSKLKKAKELYEKELEKVQFKEGSIKVIKNKGLNAVRTSHYPQSHYFLDRCDEIGLLVFTEIPGWQHIGDDKWKEQAVENVREMVTQDRNHPSIILGGVRINESQDDDAFYEKTNAMARGVWRAVVSISQRG